MLNMHENGSDRIKNFADSIVDHFGDNLLNYDYEDFDDFSLELDNAIQNGDIGNIPELDREQAFEMALNIIGASDSHSEDMDGDFDSGMASAGFGTDEDYGYYDESLIKETNEIIGMLKDSLASKKAKKLGLVHVGFGNYSDEPGGPAQYKTVNGKLRKVGYKPPKIKHAVQTAAPKAKEDDAKEKKPQKKGITDVHRVSGNKFTYEFQYNGKKYKFTLTKKERKEFKGEGSIMDIIKKRMKKKEAHLRAKQLRKGKNIENPLNFK